MNKESIPSEKRRYLRIPHKLQFDIYAHKSELRVESINLSRNGVYCKVDRAISLMADVKIFLVLPKDETEQDHDIIQCVGVVVRVDEHADDADLNGGYRIAIFFNEIGEYEQQKLDEYIEAYL